MSLRAVFIAKDDTGGCTTDGEPKSRLPPFHFWHTNPSFPLSSAPAMSQRQMDSFLLYRPLCLYARWLRALCPQAQEVRMCLTEGEALNLLVE